MTPEDLIAELEQAQEGSRELSEKVGRAVGLPPPILGKPTIEELEAILNGPAPFVKILPSGEVKAETPHYTTNLQDALGLVPEGWGWMVQSGFYAIVRSPDAAYDFGDNRWDGLHLVAGRDEEATAATPALALCIAALKAREDN